MRAEMFERAPVPVLRTRRLKADCWPLSVPLLMSWMFRPGVGVNVRVGVRVFVTVGVKVGVGQPTQGVEVDVGVLVGPASIGAFQSLDSMVIFVWSHAPHVPQPPGFERGS